MSRVRTIHDIGGGTNSQFGMQRRRLNWDPSIMALAHAVARYLEPQGVAPPVPIAKRGRKVVTGKFHGNQGGKGVTVGLSKKKRPRKKKINVVKEIKKMKKEARIERNKEICTYTRSELKSFRLTHSANKFGNNSRSIGSVSQAETYLAAIKAADVVSGIGSWNATSGSMKVQIHFDVKYMMKNNDNFPCNVIIYDFVCADTHSLGFNNIMDSFHTNVPAGNASAAEHYEDLRHNWSDIRDREKYFKIVKRMNVYLKPGDEYTFYVKAGGMYDPFEADTNTESFNKGFTHVVHFRTYGVPCHDSGTVTNIGLTPLSQVDIVEITHGKVVFDGLGNTKTRAVAGASTAIGDLGTLTNPVVNGVDVVEEIA